MEAVIVKSLLTPWKKISRCVTGPKPNFCTPNYTTRGVRGSVLRGCAPAHLQQYQAELERQRKQSEVRNAQKNAVRAEMRAQFRRKYNLPVNAEDSRRQRAVGGKVDLPRNLTRMVRSESPEEKRSGSGLLRMIQNQNISTGLHTPKKRANRRAACRVM